LRLLTASPFASPWIDGPPCPPEDCGSEVGYEHLLAVLGDPTHEEHADYQEWAGGFDPEYFDATEATAVMREYN